MGTNNPCLDVAMPRFSIMRALVDLKHAYYQQTGETLTQIDLQQDIYLALRRELLHSTKLKEWPDQIIIHGMNINERT